MIWEIWARNRGLVWLVIGITLFACLFNLVLPESIRTAEGNRTFDAHAAITLLNFQLATASVLLILAIFSCTEFNSRKGSTGFPDRLFTLPVRSLQLVAVPIVLGVAAIELICAVWVKLVFIPGDLAKWFAVLSGTYMVLYQTILWTLPGLRALRMIVLGLMANIFIFISYLPRFSINSRNFTGLSERALIVGFVGLALIGFLVAWIYIARGRSSAGSSRASLTVLLERLGDRLHGRDKVFSSAGAAQLWFEWRRYGFLLPVLVGVLCLVVIAPLSWSLRNEPAATLRILITALAMPVILALPVGKGFSKPDFWSKDLSLPAFVAVRPLATEEMVVIKMEAAALSAGISWMLVLAFVSLWLPLWANIDSLKPIRLAAMRIYGQSVYVIAALCILAAVFLTWRFLVSGLWIGLSGNRKLFAASALPYGLTPLVLLPVVLLFGPNSALRVWIHDDPDRLLSLLEWIAIVALIAKCSLAALSWGRISPQRVRQYWLIWLGSTICLIALAMLVWSGVRNVLPLDVYRLRNVLILGALFVMPFARLGLAPSFLAKNRHR